MNYWKECISAAFDEAGIEATAEQIAIVAKAVEGAHLTKGESYSLPVTGERIGVALDDLEHKIISRICPGCHGTGRTGGVGPAHTWDSECPRCRGTGTRP